MARAVTAAALVAVLAAGCGSAAKSTTTSASVTTTARSAPCPRPARLQVLGRTTVGAGVAPIAAEGTLVWAARPAAGELIRITPASTTRLHVGGTPISLAANLGRVWVAERDGNEVISLDAHSLRRLTTSYLSVPVSVYAGSLGVWALSLDSGEIYALNTINGNTSQPYDSPVGQPSEMVAAGGELWILGAQGPGLSPFNPALARIVRTGFALAGQSPSSMSAAGSTLWLAEPSSRALLRVDTSAVTLKKLTAPGGMAAVATAGGPCGLWVADGAGDLVLADPETAVPLGPVLHVGRSISSLQASGTGVWATDPVDGTVVHVAEAG